MFFDDIKQPWICHKLHLRIISFILANSLSFLNEISFIFDLGGWHLSYAKFQEIVGVITSYRYFEVETRKLFAFHAINFHIYFSL